jgi:hypothetical protein
MCNGHSAEGKEGWSKFNIGGEGVKGKRGGQGQNALVTSPETSYVTALQTSEEL